MSDITINELNEKIKQLTVTVEKQAVLITKTGQQLLEIQVNNIKQKMSQDDPKVNIDLSDYATNEDIVQLVGELQGQLDHLEDRTIARMFNSQLTKVQRKKLIAPISNKDGEFPSADTYPKTVDDFLIMTKIVIIELCEFYELIVPTNEDLQQFLNDELQTLEQANANLSKSLIANIDDFSEADVKELQDELARFLGLTFRNNEHSY